MKNTIKTILLFAAFMIGGVIFQISCSNDDNSSSPAAQLNKVIFVKGAGDTQTVWICDYDGSNLSQIPITFPANVVINSTNGNAYPRLSPDGQKVFVAAHNTSDGSFGIYSFDVDGTNSQEIYNSGPYTGTANNVIGIGSVN